MRLQGVIHRVDLVKTADLCRISASTGAAFNPTQALQFGVQALQRMREVADRRRAEAAQQQPQAQCGQPHLRFSYEGATRRLWCEEVPEGALPKRVRSCLVACGVQVPEAAG